MTLEELAQSLGGELHHPHPQRTVSNINSIMDATEEDITIFFDLRYREYLPQTQAACVLIGQEKAFEMLCQTYQKPYLKVNRPQEAFIQLIHCFRREQRKTPSISPQAVVGRNVVLGGNVTLSPYSVLEDDVSIGEGTVLHPFVYVGKGCRIGRETVLHAHVAVYPGCQVGDRVVIHSGAVIGTDGFGYMDSQGQRIKIPQVGTVVIEDDVEIGSNVCIARATLGKTHIRKGVKIDNLVHIAHNVSVGENTAMAAQVGVSGSCVIGKHATIAGQVGIIDHIHIGDEVVITPQSGIVKDIPGSEIYSGTYAMDHLNWKRVQVVLPKLPHIYKVVGDLNKRVDKLENNHHHNGSSTDSLLREDQA